MTDFITLTKDTDHGPAGSRLRILGRAEDPAAGAIDRRKATSLVSDHGVAVWGAPKKLNKGKT